MRISTPKILPAGIDQFLISFCNLIRLARGLRERCPSAEKGGGHELRRPGKDSPMRVIAGKFRSRLLRSLRGLDIRPTSDRLRETLFDILTAGNPQALAGSVWLDLFAGTGAVGIEALSRGAAMVYFVECSKHATELVRQNLQSLGIAEGFQVLQQESAPAISQLERQQ